MSGPQELERDALAELAVGTLREIHARRAALSDLPHDAVRADARSLEAGRRARLVEDGRGGARGRGGQETPRARVMSQQRLDVAAQLGVGAPLIEQGSPAGRIAVERRVQHGLHFRPALHLHGASSSRSASSRTRRALSHSRSIVRVETSSMRAISVSESPAKKRSSTITRRRGSTTSSCSRAESTARISSSSNSIAVSPSPSETISMSPPRRRALRLRAKSTSSCRMARDAAPKKWARLSQSVDAPLSLRKVS